MDIGLIILLLLISLILFLFKTLSSTSSSSSSHPPLPPGPLPFIGTLLWLCTSFSQLEPILLSLHAKYGPIITLPFASLPAIFIADHSLAHQALLQNGAVFSDRPNAIGTSKIINTHHHNISSCRYGPTWRALRRNLAAQIFHPTRIRSFSDGRKWVLEALIQRLQSHSQSHVVKLKDYLLHAIFSLLLFMCFGEKLNDERINDIKHVQRRLILNYNKFLLLNFWPKLVCRILLRNRWEEYMRLREEQAELMCPLILRARKAKEDKNINKHVVSYVDTLLTLEWPEEKRKLNDGEIVTLASEFLNAGTDTTATALEWVMANLVKYPHMLEKIVEEIRSVMGEDSEEKVVSENYLNKLPYLKGVVLEGLRRHPPVRVLIPHAVTKDVVLSDYLVPKRGMVNFMVAKMGWDPRVWENPMEFKPERFLKSGEVEEFDFVGSKEIKMMPFGAGRRMCPGFELAMLHMEFFVANLVWNFKWKAASDGGNVDLSEKQEFTMVMKNPLHVNVFPRF